MGRYGSHVEQTYSQRIRLKNSKALTGSNLMSHLPSASLVNRKWAIAIDPSYISKAGKKTPHIGRFGRDVHSLLNMVSKSWVLASLILMPKTA